MLLRRYDKATNQAARQVISTYSTSFSLATRLLRGRVRTDIRNLYAMVRIADEIVDGTASAAGLDSAAVRDELDRYEDQVLRAPHVRFHTDPVIHAYAITARRCEFSDDYVRAFFRSMRWDTAENACSTREFHDYVYGSAEVIGLLCLQVFLAGRDVYSAERERMTAGARRLGAAFQKVNFLRDLGEDSLELGRTYFPELAAKKLDWETKNALVEDIRADLAAAQRAIPLLPVDARIGVQAATDLFTALTDRIDRLSPAEVADPHSRVRVPGYEKSLITARAVRKAMVRQDGLEPEGPEEA